MKKTTLLSSIALSLSLSTFAIAQADQGEQLKVVDQLIDFTELAWNTSSSRPPKAELAWNTSSSRPPKAELA